MASIFGPKSASILRPESRHHNSGVSRFWGQSCVQTTGTFFLGFFAPPYEAAGERLTFRIPLLAFRCALWEWASLGLEHPLPDIMSSENCAVQLWVYGPVTGGGWLRRSVCLDARAKTNGGTTPTKRKGRALTVLQLRLRGLQCGTEACSEKAGGQVRVIAPGCPNEREQGH